MPVHYLDWITRDLLRAERGAFFVFGDNGARVGLGGQAKEMRGEPNAIGVATLYAPGVFYRADDPNALLTVTADLSLVAGVLSRNAKVYVPKAGLGTGLARLEEHAPLLHQLILAFFRAAPGEPCPWGQ